MNANLNMNSYYTGRYQSSGDIRRAYLANSRKTEAIAFIKKALLNPKVWYTLFSLKVVLSVFCAIGLFTVIGAIEVGSLSSLSGIFSAVVIAAVECLCFIPIGNRPSSKIKK